MEIAEYMTRFSRKLPAPPHEFRTFSACPSGAKSPSLQERGEGDFFLSDEPIVPKRKLRRSSILQLIGDRLEGVARVVTNRLDRGQAHDDDQRQHHGVFNSRWAVFRNQETLHFLGETLHEVPPISLGRKRLNHRGTQLNKESYDLPGSLSRSDNGLP
jgi:hypothetical protein